MNKAINIDSLLLFREFEPDDWLAVHEYACDSEVTKYMEWGPNTPIETQNYIQHTINARQQQPRKNYDFAVVLKQNNQLIGSCSICISNFTDREGWIGYCFNRNYWGNGYATAATKFIIQFGFTNLNLYRIFGTCDPLNLASERVMQKASMQFQGKLPAHKLVKGKWRDSLLYELFQPE
jgi:[ribosomal protein S5]-alanine N-acetyltransferase